MGKRKKKSVKKQKILSAHKLGHATQETGDLWNVWFHEDRVKGKSRCVADRVTRDVALIILKEIDETGAAVYGKAESDHIL